MDESGATEDGDSSLSTDKQELLVVVISPKGDLILDVIFTTSKETLKAARKANTVRLGQAKYRPPLKSRVRVGYRVQLDVLKKHSRYFENLLSDPRFQEAKTIAAALSRLSLQKVSAADAEEKDLPRVQIVDDDEATRSSGRDAVFADLLRILHGHDAAQKAPSLSYVAVLAVLADRFDCAEPVSRYLKSGLKFKWPVTRVPPRDDDARLSTAAEEVIRQKILVSWVLDQPTRMQVATRELIMYGSRRWSVFPDTEMTGAAWWDLPDDLENELQYRRECILNTIASAIQHFLALYTSRNRQCRLGYDSSAACDSYQLGEMVRFLTSRRLLYLVDFSPASVDKVSDSSQTEIGGIIATLKQCPAYQIDKNHTNCGLRIRLLPILELIQSMLSSNVIAIPRLPWKRDRAATSWIPKGGDDDRDGDEDRRVFRFTHGLAADERLRYEGTMAADRLARQLFTARSWDWTPDS
ncbi:hypothetical protein VTK73DRAFT_8600 [Phialemonium thermophilum]|uniref:Uncharacterized protein n=1 Tax=Phialemonium thermophilum TaxID=223376 RepID=A0ABR3XPS4_9PEZI